MHTEYLLQLHSIRHCRLRNACRSNLGSLFGANSSCLPGRSLLLPNLALTEYYLRIICSTGRSLVICSLSLTRSGFWGTSLGGSRLDGNTVTWASLCGCYLTLSCLFQCRLLKFGFGRSSNELGCSVGLICTGRSKIRIVHFRWLLCRFSFRLSVLINCEVLSQLPCKFFSLGRYFYFWHCVFQFEEEVTAHLKKIDDVWLRSD